MDPLFMLYAMECEGEIDTPAGRINNFLKTLPEGLSDEEIYQLALKDGFSPEEIDEFL